MGPRAQGGPCPVPAWAKAEVSFQMALVAVGGCRVTLMVGMWTGSAPCASAAPGPRAGAVPVVARSALAWSCCFGNPAAWGLLSQLGVIQGCCCETWGGLALLSSSRGVTRGWSTAGALSSTFSMCLFSHWPGAADVLCGHPGDPGLRLLGVPEQGDGSRDLRGGRAARGWLRYHPGHIPLHDS